jgi:uncharacterized membrane protein
MELRGLVTPRARRSKRAEYAIVTLVIIAIIAVAAWLVSQDVTAGL